MDAAVSAPVGRELILGGQRSGKSRLAEARAAAWLAGAPRRRAVLIATATAGHDDDNEMGERIARHRRDRAAHAPGLETLEEPVALVEAIAAHSTPDTLLLVDCLTLWLANQLMPPDQFLKPNRAAVQAQPDATAMLSIAIRDAAGPLVLVGNEIGLGVIPMGRDVRAFVDTLGRLNQDVAAACDRVTLMVAGLPLTLKAPS